MKKYLGELIKEENIKFGNNNLILAPVGSGKTHYIINDLIPQFKNVLYLCDTSALKEQIISDLYGRKNVEVMTYSAFGTRITTSNNWILMSDYDCIISDEFHNLIDYDNKFNTVEYSHAIKFLIEENNIIKKFYFTATPYNYKVARETDKMLSYDNIKEYNFLDREDIMSYTQKNFYELNSFREIANEIEIISPSILQGNKVLIFTEKIDTQNKIEESIVNLDIDGLNPICLWSINNKKKPMSGEQVKVRQYILDNNTIPDEYNILIINKSMETGINIKDKRFLYCFINTSNLTTRTQARGRLRHDIDTVWYIDSMKDTEIKAHNKEHLLAPYLDRRLSTKDKKALCRDFNLVDGKGRDVGWTSIKKFILEVGYTVKDKKSNGIRYTIISSN